MLRKFALTALCGCTLLSSAFAAEVVSIEPANVEITSLKSVEVVRVSSGPVKVNGWRLMVDDSNYSHMVRVTSDGDTLRITPTDTAEVGTYDLLIDTSRGPVRIALHLSLRDEEGLLESATQELGDRNKAMHAVGLTTTIPHETVTTTWTLPPQYKPGETLVLSAPADEPGTVYRWVVNDTVVVEGQPKLEYRFSDEGQYNVRLERQAPEGRWVRVSEGNTFVSSSAAVAMTAEVGQRINFTGPEGFTSYEWSHDGTVISRAREATIKFDTAGVYSVFCRAQQPASQPGTDFMMVRYEVTVH
jgi:plastocyanin